MLRGRRETSTDPALAERNLAVARRWIDVFNERDDVAEAAVRAPMDSEAWTRFLAGFVKGFPDLRLTVEDAVGDGEFVAQRIHFEGTHIGKFQALPPTHRKVSFYGVELNRFVDGQVAEHWFQLDALSLLQQLGLVVVPSPRLVPRLLAHQLKKLRKIR